MADERLTTNGDALATELRRLAMETPENRFCVRVTVREAAILRALIRWAEEAR